MHVVRQLPRIEDERLLIGPETADDAGVYRLTDDLALIQTVDFITPVVDDPYMFGQIAAANSLSDVYAMGGQPITAMNIVGFPVGILDLDVLTQILKGGIEKMKEAGVVLMGGHTVDDRELKYGLSVTGIVHPRRIMSNAGARPGDRIILTKPVGIGILTTAIKAGETKPDVADRMISSMATLNKVAAQAMVECEAHACTDITGFGLLGHAFEVADNSHVGLRLFAADIPVFSGAVELSRDGYLPGGSISNQEFYSRYVIWESSASEEYKAVFYDAQTSGGLFISAEKGQADRLLHLLHERGVSDAAVIGEAIQEPRGRIIVM
jgi:selenide,water dikinase